MSDTLIDLITAVIAGNAFLALTIIISRTDRRTQRRHLAKMRHERTWIHIAREAFVTGDLTLDEFETVAAWLLAEGFADRQREAGEFINWRAVIAPGRRRHRPKLWPA